jgi:hypothetical protein
MELKHWQVKFKLGEVEREMTIDGDAVQTEADVKKHLEAKFPGAKLTSADDGSKK